MQFTTMEFTNLIRGKNGKGSVCLYRIVLYNLRDKKQSEEIIHGVIVDLSRYNCWWYWFRLWLVSRESLPKQFCSLSDKCSLFQNTIARVSDDAFHKALILTHAEYRFVVSEQLAEMKIDGDIFLEPLSKNTAPSIFASALIAQKRCAEAVLIVLLLDHSIMINMLACRDVFLRVLKRWRIQILSRCRAQPARNGVWL